MPRPHLTRWDPFGFTKKMTPERKGEGAACRDQQRRLAMIGIMGFVSASKGLIVPGMDGLGSRSTGEVMAPFTAATICRSSRRWSPTSFPSRCVRTMARCTCSLWRARVRGWYEGVDARASLRWALGERAR